MLCKWCGNELPEGSIYCNSCGKNQGSEVSSEKPTVKEALKKRLSLFIGLGGLIILLFLAVILFFNNPIVAFTKAINDGSYKKAISIYDNKISGNTDKGRKLEERLSKEIQDLLSGFLGGKLDHQNVMGKLDTIGKARLVSNQVSDAKLEINKLHNSRIAYEKGMEYKRAGDYIASVIEFGKVIKRDDNYNNARENINQLSSGFKNEIIKQVEMLASAGDYDGAITKVKEVLKALPQDVDLIAKLAVYEKHFEQQQADERQIEMANMIESQEVCVQSAKVVKTGTYIDFYHVQVIVENNSDKVVKDFTVGMLGYDVNGYPLNISYSDYLMKGRAPAVNIQPGKTFGAGSGWDLNYNEEKVKTVLACVNTVEYYDGSIWENPYYEHWLEAHEGKPLK